MKRGGGGRKQEGGGSRGHKREVGGRHRPRSLVLLIVMGGMMGMIHRERQSN